MWTLLSSSSDFVGESLIRFGESTGLAGFFSAMGWGNIVMIGIAFFLLYLAIRHKFEPLLLLTIAFGMLLTNLPGANLYHTELFAGGHVHWDIFVAKAGLLDYLYLGVKLGIYPCLIFLGVGAMTDFGPLIANPKSFLLGAAAQIGIFVTFLGAYAIGFSPEQSGSIGIIGGADGPTAIYLTSMLAPELLGPIAVAAYSYMASCRSSSRPSCDCSPTSTNVRSVCARCVRYRKPSVSSSRSSSRSSSPCCCRAQCRSWAV